MDAKTSKELRVISMGFKYNSSWYYEAQFYLALAEHNSAPKADFETLSLV
jgi:hypothetical protein